MQILELGAGEDYNVYRHISLLKRAGEDYISLQKRLKCLTVFLINVFYLLSLNVILFYLIF